MLSGHRRKKVYEILGLEEIDAIIKDLNDDESTIFMVDSNMYREKLLPSEKAFAYRMKMEAMKHQGKTTPSHSQAIRIRKLSKKKLLTFDDLDKILLEEKGNQHEKISFNKSKIISVLPFDLVKRDKRYIEQYIIEAIKSYKTTNK